ncbi:MAG: sigma-54 dependent transcriptional regulator [Deltaproteobacteria bacterium]|nr:sigma-54 dependent transcriptional regulator [Deltaproteobacteria bacterium]
MPEGTILIVDDDADMVDLLRETFTDAGYTIVTALRGRDALARTAAGGVDVVVSDLRMEGFDGLDLLDEVRRVDARIPLILMTAFGAVESAVDAVKRGAFHYLTKPFALEELLLYVERALVARGLRDENDRLRVLADERSGSKAILGASPAIQPMLELVRRAARSPAPALIRGESGVGKELIARALHLDGPRRHRAFVPLNCTAIPEDLLESELFGHARGSFTGAGGARRGLFVEADGGTLFLDEIGDMPPTVQAKLLRVLEDGVIRSVGADSARTVDVRIVAATHQDLDARARLGQFRPDLLFRLRVLAIDVPPLRDRSDDIALFVARFLADARGRNPTSSVTSVTPAAMEAMTRARWPGNVRELKHLMERMVVLAPGPTIDVDDVSPWLDVGPSPVERAKDGLVTLRQLENDYISWVLEKCGGNRTRAAEILGVDPSTLYRRTRAGS